MKVLQIIKGMDIGGQNGGSEKFGLELSLRLQSAGIDVSLCSFYSHSTKMEKFWEDRLNREGIEVMFAVNTSRGNPLAGFREITSVIKNQSFSLVHSHFQIGSLAAVYLKLARIIPKIVRTAHISKEWGDGWLAWAARLIFTRIIFPIFFDAETAVSQDITGQLNRRLVGRLKKKKAQCIYNAIPDTWIVGAGERLKNYQFLPHHPEQFVIGSVGRLTRRKGFSYLLRAFALVESKIPEGRLWLIGDGEDRMKLEQISNQLGVSSKVTFMGQQGDINSLLSQMDLFVLPSLQEGLSTVLLEAMACGVPVIATLIPGTREIIRQGETGWLALPANPIDLANKIETAYLNPDKRRNFSITALSEIKAFSFSSAVDSYLRLYRSLVNEQ